MAIRKYVDPAAIGEALDSTGWSLVEELETVVDLARNGEPNERLSAIRVLHKFRTDALKLSGAVAEVTRSERLDDGTVVRQRLRARIDDTEFSANGAFSESTGEAGGSEGGGGVDSGAGAEAQADSVAPRATGDRVVLEAGPIQPDGPGVEGVLGPHGH